MIANRLHAPLRPDERFAEHYLAQPNRLLELARETGNRGLIGIAVDLIKTRKARTRRKG